MATILARMLAEKKVWEQWLTESYLPKAFHQQHKFETEGQRAIKEYYYLSESRTGVSLLGHEIGPVMPMADSLWEWEWVRARDARL